MWDLHENEKYFGSIFMQLFRAVIKVHMMGFHKSADKSGQSDKYVYVGNILF